MGKYTITIEQLDAGMDKLAEELDKKEREMKKTIENAKLEALKEHLDIGSQGAGAEIGISNNTYTYGGQKYLVMTDDEAHETAKQYIRESLWAFNADFLSWHSSTEACIFEVLSRQYEGANNAIFSLVSDFNQLVADAIMIDGRGHFINSYDGHEHEYCIDGEYIYIYRVG